MSKYKCEYCNIKCVLEVNDGANIPHVCPYRPETNEYGLQEEYTDPPWEEIPKQQIDKEEKDG